MLRYVLILLVRSYYILVPHRVRNVIAAQVRYADLVTHAHQSLQSDCHPAFKGRAIDSLERILDNETGLILKLTESSNSARQIQSGVSNAQRPSKEWE